MNRTDLQWLARERIREAKVLLAADRFPGAYYLAGYAIECGLKSCIIAHLMKTDQFPEKRYSEQCWTHNLEQLVGLAGLKGELDADSAADVDLLSNWGITKDWNESSRYARKSMADAQDLYDAITDKKHGMLPWVKKYW